VGDSLQKERALSAGREPVLAVLHKGEEVLSDLNGDAQLSRVLKRTGKWDDLKADYYANGGTVGRMVSPYWEEESSGRGRSGRRGPVASGTTVNNYIEVHANDANSFRKSENQILAESERRSRRAIARG
jgi:hypothetical protein